METITGWLKFFAIIGGILLLGFIFKWLGLLDWFDLLGEVVLRAVALAMFLFGGVVVYFLFKGDMDREKENGVSKYRNWHFIFHCALLIGAAVVMTFWGSCAPRF